MTDDTVQRFELLYRQHFRSVLSFALARLEPESAKDAVAETFLIAWRRLPEVPDNPAPWLFAVAGKVIAGQFRSHARREALRVRLETMGAAAEPGDPGEEVGERAVVLAAFTKLSENDREVLRLAAWDGLNSRDAATVLGITRFAFGVRLHRARRRFAATLAASEPAPQADPPSPRRRGNAATQPGSHDLVSLGSPEEVR